MKYWIPYGFSTGTLLPVSQHSLLLLLCLSFSFISMLIFGRDSEVNFLFPQSNNAICFELARRSSVPLLHVLVNARPLTSALRLHRGSLLSPDSQNAVKASLCQCCRIAPVHTRHRESWNHAPEPAVWVQTPAPPFVSWATYGRPPKLSGPQFPLL